MIDPVIVYDSGFLFLQGQWLIDYIQWLGGNVEIAIRSVGRNFLWLTIGVIVGMIIGTIPGMGGVVTLTILLPFSLGLDQSQAFTLLAGGLGATTFSGSITAILINTPGTSSNAATLIDGYPMTQQGESSVAITLSAISSAMGAVFAGIIFILAIPIMIEVVLLFGPGQIFWIVLFAIIVIPLAVANRPLYGILTAALGAIVAFTGRAPQTAEPRFIFDQTILLDGFGLIPMLIGFFAVAEIVRVAALERDRIVDFDQVRLTGSKVRAAKIWFEHKFLWLRCSLIGLVVGAIPGAGGSTAAFVAYAHAAQTTTNPNFGNGAPEGVIAPESANDAKDGGQLFPTLGLGIPGSGTMAILLAGFLVHGILPGPTIMVDRTDIVLTIAIAVICSNIMTSIIGVTFANGFTNLLKIPIPRIYTFIVFVSFAVVFVDRTSLFDVGTAIFFAGIGLVLVSLGISRIPFLIAFILAGIMEHNYHLALAFSIGDHHEAFLAGPLNQGLILVVVISVILLLAPREKLHSLIRW